ncbi:MAG: glycosyltransferase family 4 protein [Candidatus Hermodarchaeota archaeon]
MKKLNICLVALAISPDKEDGEATVIRAFYDYLKKCGHQVTVLTGLWNKKLHIPDIIQFKLITKRFLWIPHFIFKVFKYLRTHKFDIIHGNGPKGALPIIIAGKKRFISSIYDLGPFEANYMQSPLEKLLIRLIAKKSTYITTSSNYSKNEFKYFIPDIDKRKIINTYLGIDEMYKPKPVKAEQLKRNLNLNGLILLYIGRIAYYKGVESIINAYYKIKKIYKDISLVIGGSPDFTMEKTYQRWKRDFSDINFVGFVPTKLLPVYYSMADIFITYSYASEGFGFTPIEAIACGTPVITSSIPAYREVLQDNAIFVPPKQPDLLAKEIINLIKNNELRKELIKKAQNFIKRYDWDMIGKKIEDIYFKFLSE